MEQKALANIIFIPVLIIGLFCMFYFPSKKQVLIYVFSGILILSIYYLYLVYFSNISYKSKKILEWIPLATIAGLVGSLSLILRMKMIKEGVWESISFVDSGILLLFLGLYGIIQSISLFKSKYMIEKNKIHFYSNIEKTYDLGEIYAILQQESSIIVFSSKKEYEEYSSDFDESNSRNIKSTTRNASKNIMNIVSSQDALQKKYSAIILL